MKCPTCNHDDTCVLETRTQFDGSVVMRRRKCLSCRFRFKTLEKLDIGGMSVQKRDTSCELFDSSKLKKGVMLACQKRPVKESQVNKLVGEVEKILLERGSLMVSSKEVGEVVLGLLKKIDLVAYMRYASVCRQFDNVIHFEKEIRKLRES